MKKRRIIFPIVIILVFLLGVGVLLYPTIGAYLNQFSQSRAVSGYYGEVEKISEVDYSDIINSANAYNQSLLGRNLDRFMPTDDELKQYNKLLSYNGSQIMGVLEIETIGVKLAIYHGTSEGVLQVGLGHIEGSSLPIGGLGTHTAISGHRGVPSAILLTHLDKLIIGDTFTIHVLREVLTYKVDQILVVEPEDMSAMEIEEGKDYCTLVTCTPYGINSHRLLVRGHRVENAAEEDDAPVVARTVEADAHQYSLVWVVVAVAGFTLVISAIIGTVSLIAANKSKKK